MSELSTEDPNLNEIERFTSQPDISQPDVSQTVQHCTFEIEPSNSFISYFNHSKTN